MGLGAGEELPLREAQGFTVAPEEGFALSCESCLTPSVVANMTGQQRPTGVSAVPEVTRLRWQSHPPQPYQFPHLVPQYLD